MNCAFIRNAALLCGLVFPFAALFAQNPNTPQVETQQNAANRPGPQVELNPATPEVSDPALGEIGVVNRRPRPKMFSVSTSQSLNFTTNAFLTHDNAVEAFSWNGRLDASFVPYATRSFTPRLTFEQNFFRYDHVSQLDFDSQTLRADVKYSLTSDDSWFVNGSYGWTRLYSHRDGIGEFYKFGLLDANITRIAPLPESPFTLGTTGGLYWRQGDPSQFDRVSAYLTGLLIYKFSETVQFSTFVRPEFQIYTNDPADDTREDFNVTIGATASWAPRDYLALVASAVYVGNFSSESVRRYDVFTPALVLGARIAF
jgi:hypothetical protein